MKDSNKENLAGNCGAYEVRVEPGRGGCGASQVVNKRNPCNRIATWNVRTLLQVGKLENVKEEMRRGGLDVLAMMETRWEGTGEFWSEEYKVVYSGDKRGRNGVALMMNREWEKRITMIDQRNDRLMMIRFKMEPVNMTLIIVYMPTSTSTEEEVEEIYGEIEDMMEMIGDRENVVLMGDWNAVVGEGEDGREVGKFGLGKRNERGERLVDFCKQMNLTLVNTTFQVPKRRRYTWKMPGDIGRYQIDYIIVKNRYRNQVKSCKTYPGADVDSDHNMIMMKCCIKMKKLQKRKERRRWNLREFKNKEKRLRYEERLEELMEEKGEEITGVEENWGRIKTAIIKSAEETIGRREKDIRKPWINEEIVQMFKERRKYKDAKDNKGKENYKKLKNEINRKCKKSKEEWFEENCKDIEQLMTRGQFDMAYNKIGKMNQGGKNRSRSGILRDRTGRVLTSEEEVGNRWKEYLEELYKGEGVMEKREGKNRGEEEECPSIIREEYDKAINSLKKGKAAGIDDIPAELLQYAGEGTHRKIFGMIRDIYELGVVPEDFCKSIVIPIPKRTKADKCELYRTINLIPHVSKILLKILCNRMEVKYEQLMSKDQFGFRKGQGTREAIVSLRILLERRIDMNRKTFVCFVDLEKAFDRVEWRGLAGMMERMGLDWKDRKIIKMIYERQEMRMRVGEVEISAEVKRGVRQGCTLSPVLFNLYIEEAMNRIREKANLGVKVGGKGVEWLRFADDIAVLADSEDKLRRGMERMVKIFEEYGMKINFGKTKMMIVSKEEEKDGDFNINGNVIERVKRFRYLGSIITQDGRSTEDIKSRIAIAKQRFYEYKGILTSNMSEELRKRLIKVYVWSTALYGCEAWTIGERDKKKIEAFEMWCWRRMYKVKWVERKTNVEVLRRAREERCIIQNIQERRRRMMGHALRQDGMIGEIMEGKITGKRSRGRPRDNYVKKLQESCGVGRYEVMKRLAEEREEWRLVVAVHPPILG